MSSHNAAEIEILRCTYTPRFTASSEEVFYICTYCEIHRGMHIIVYVFMYMYTVYGKDL